MQRLMSSSIELSISATTPSHFGSKLDPTRTELIITGYCNLCRYEHMPMDIIQIIILFFNSLFYWKIHKDEIYALKYYDMISKFKSSGRMRWEYKLNEVIMRFLFLTFDPFNIYQFAKCPVNIPNQVIMNPACNDVEFTFKIIQNQASSYFLELITNWDKITSVIFRVRVFCIENSNEFNKICYVTNDENMEICNYKQLSIWSNSKLFETHDIVNIGSEIEILHILYKDNRYWAKSSYSWFKDVMDQKKCLSVCFHPDYSNYFDSGCFRIADKYYYLFDEYERRKTFLQFIGYYCIEIRKLPYDIILVRDNTNHLSLFENFNETITTAIQERIKYDVAAILTTYWQKLQKRSSKEHTLKKKRSWDSLRKYKHQNKTIKMHKIYRNNKRKYKYNRW